MHSCFLLHHPGPLAPPPKPWLLLCLPPECKSLRQRAVSNLFCWILSLLHGNKSRTLCLTALLRHVQFFATLWTIYIAQQAPLFMGFSRQEYWSGSSKGIFPTQRFNSRLLQCRWILYRFEAPWKPKEHSTEWINPWQHPPATFLLKFLYNLSILFIHLSVDGHLVCLHFLGIVIMLQWLLIYKCLFESLPSILLGIHIEMELLDHMFIPYLTFRKTVCCIVLQRWQIQTALNGKFMSSFPFVL